MNAYETSTEVASDSTVIIPGHVIMPIVRYAAPSGTLAQGDTITGQIIIRDSSGNIKPLDFDGEFIVTMKDWPSDASSEILAVLNMNFVESRIAPVSPFIPPMGL